MLAFIANTIPTLGAIENAQAIGSSFSRPLSAPMEPFTMQTAGNLEVTFNEYKDPKATVAVAIWELLSSFQDFYDLV